MKKLFLILLIFVLTIAVHAANIGDDTVNIGQKGSTGNKALIFRDANNSQLGVDHASGDLSWTGNNLTLGNGVSGDKKFIFDIGAGANNPYFFYNSTKSKLGFSNDGTLIKDIGSGAGSGGGENFNNGFTSENNANAEDGTSGWTASAGDFFVTSSVADWVTATSYSIGDKVVESGIIYKANTAHTSGTFASDIANWDKITGADALEGDSSFVWIPAAQNDTLTSPVLDFNKDIFKGSSCQSLITYIGGDENLSLKVLNADNEELSSEELVAHSITSNESGFFICPTKTAIDADADKGNLRFRIENTGATASAAIKFDKNYLGTLIGLSETTLPDKATASFNVCSLANFNGDIGWSCSPNSTGNYSITFNYGLTENPNVIVTDNSGSSSTACIGLALSTTEVNVTCFNTTSGAAVDRAYTVEITRAGADAKQSVQVYKSIPKVAENENEFTVQVVSGGSIGSQNPSILSGCSSGATGTYTCTYSETLSTDMLLTGNVNDGNGSCINGNVRFFSSSNTGFSYNVSDADTAALINCAVNLKLTKRGSDYKKPVVQPVIVGQVRNSYAESASKNVSVESATILSTCNLSGATVFGSSWIDSVTGSATSTGCVVNFNTDVIDGRPNCILTGLTAPSNNCSITALSGTSASVQCSAGVTLEMMCLSVSK